MGVVVADLKSDGGRLLSKGGLRVTARVGEMATAGL